MPAGPSFQAIYIDSGGVGDAVAIAAAGVSCEGEAGSCSCAGIDGDGPQLTIGTGVAGEIHLAYQDAASAVAATGQPKGGASARQPAGAGVGGVLPAGASFQARHIDCADVGDSVAIAGTGISCQGEAGGNGCAVINGDFV